MTAALTLEQSCFSVFCLSKRQLSYLQNAPSAVFLVAEQQGRIVGQGIGLVRRHRKGLSGRIYSLSVSQSCRRQKIGHRILVAMVEDLRSRGVNRIYLEVEQSNTPAIRLYEQYGFRSVGELPDYYGQGCAGLRMKVEF